MNLLKVISSRLLSAYVSTSSPWKLQDWNVEKTDVPDRSQVLHSSKILTIQQGITRGVSSVGKP